MENTHNFYMPKINLVGVGSIKDLPNELMPLKLSKVLIVTDKNIISLGYVENIEKILKSLFIAYDVFDGVLHPNPTVSFVEDGLKYFPNKLNLLVRDYDFVISIGGGSNHDCAKAIATVATNGGSIIDYEGWNKVTKPMLPVICINTTGGSGTETTMFAIITDNTRKVKMVIGSPMMTPSICINDPLFMGTMSKEVTATSGFDAFAQSIEAYVSTESSPITDSLALGALKMSFEFLRRAYENGNDLEAREKMMFAGMMAGMAFNNSGLGYLHSIVHQLGGFYNQIHGDYEGIILPRIFEFNSSAISDERIFKIAEAMNIKVNNKVQAVDKIIEVMIKLRSDLGMPSSLREMGVEEENIELFAHNALKDITALVNPRKGTHADIVNIIKSAM